MEKLKPNLEDCQGCYKFIKGGSLIADRFYVKEDACMILNRHQPCPGIVTTWAKSSESKIPVEKENPVEN